MWCSTASTASVRKPASSATAARTFRHSPARCGRVDGSTGHGWPIYLSHKDTMMGIFSLLVIGGIGFGLMRQLKKMQREQLQAIRRGSLPAGTTQAQVIDVQAFPA